MQTKSLLKAGVLALSGLGIVTGAAIANPTKWTSNGREYIVFDNLTPGDQISISLANQDLTRRATANACGWLSLSVNQTYPSPTSIALSSDDGITYGAAQDLSGATQGFLRCSNGVVVDGAGNLAANPSSPFLDGSGRTIIPGLMQNQRYNVKYVGEPATLSPRVNACSFVQITQDPNRRDLTNFTYNGTGYTLAGLTEAVPPRCVTINGDRVRYEGQP